MSGGRITTWLSLVKFSHSIFALPFALMSAWLAADGLPEARVLLLVIGCAVAARTAAMGFNRWLDRASDARNPRTRQREIPSGALGAPAVLALVVVSCVLFVLGAFLLNPLAGKLSLPVLVVLLGYSAMKRVHWSAHLVLGLSLGLAPLGAWVAVRGNLEGDLWVPLSLAAAVLTWVAGFDLIYACQDADFDRREGLHSFPARFGLARSLKASELLHALTALGLVFLGLRAELGTIYFLSLAVVCALLVWQHRIVAPDDLSRVDMAFFTLNGWVGIGLFLGTALDLASGGF